MLRIRIMVVGRTRSPFLHEGERFYLKRLRRYAKTEWVEVKAARISRGRAETEIRREEGKNLLKRMSADDFPVSLDRTGSEYDSEGLARWLEGLSTRAVGPVCFLVGGALGLDPDLVGKSKEVLSLSRLTLTHEMVRMVLLEQLYRACTIRAGEKYHK